MKKHREPPTSIRFTQAELAVIDKAIAQGDLFRRPTRGAFIRQAALFTAEACNRALQVTDAEPGELGKKKSKRHAA